MIIIEFENIRLQLISEDDLEMIRQWRNAPHVAGYMEYQAEIDKQEQITWFNSLRPHENLYFKILISNTAIGIINLKNIRWDLKETEAGVFVGREDFRGTITPILSVFILMKLVFECFEFEKLWAKISNKNEQAIRFNTELGYMLHSKVNKDFDQYVCDRNGFCSPQSSISKIQELFTKNGQIKIHVDKASDWILPYLHLNDHRFQLAMDED